jgi:hypothetical protein
LAFAARSLFISILIALAFGLGFVILSIAEEGTRGAVAETTTAVLPLWIGRLAVRGDDLGRPLASRLRTAGLR